MTLDTAAVLWYQDAFQENRGALCVIVICDLCGNRKIGTGRWIPRAGFADRLVVGGDALFADLDPEVVRRRIAFGETDPEILQHATYESTHTEEEQNAIRDNPGQWDYLRTDEERQRRRKSVKAAPHPQVVTIGSGRGIPTFFCREHQYFHAPPDLISKAKAFKRAPHLGPKRVRVTEAERW